MNGERAGLDTCQLFVQRNDAVLRLRRFDGLLQHLRSASFLSPLTLLVIILASETDYLRRQFSTLRSSSPS